MSYQIIKDIKIRPNEVRDFFQIFPETANKTIDLWQEHHVVGLDIMLHNRGAASITLTIDKQSTKTILAGDVFSWSNIKYSLVEVASTVAYDLMVAGVRQ